MIRQIAQFLFMALAILFMNCSDNSTQPDPVELSIVTPVGGEIWFLYGDVNITWTSENAGEKIKIELSRDNGASWELVAETVNSGAFTWAVSGAESENVLLRLMDGDSGRSTTLDIPIRIKKLGNLDIDFYLHYVYDPYPTYQTVIWLDDENGDFVQSLFVSDWLARGGYNSRYVCPTWNSKANWTDGDTEDIDAVTGATPDWGVYSDYSFDVSDRGIAPGDYKLSIETHLTDEYNILYTGDVELNGENNSTEPEAIYRPEQHSLAGQVLENVRMEYIFVE